ncbi:DUF4345 domain-containing protein [Altererythrobacter aquiaggeris]|uniref:DUF4345 domain-containing protein n=1 Tax=Aestuarierythrobacter aquiaggeris TaxID=1898396 RepID=UPI0030178A5C
MRRALVVLTIMFGATCAAIALVHIAFGPSSIPGSVPVNATMDSQDRFYASLFLGFGAALIWCARNLRRRRTIYFALLAVFFVGGLARGVSALQAGLPDPLFQVLWALELVLPPVFWLWHRAVFGNNRLR